MTEQPITKSLGQRLRQAREEQNISCEDVADHLRVSVAVIELLESEVYELEKITVYHRGYIRGYARLVKLSDKEIADEFERLGLVSKAHAKQPVKIQLKQTSIKDKPLRLFSYFIIALLVLLIFVWWHSHSGDNNGNLSSAIVQPGTMNKQAAVINNNQQTLVASKVSGKAQQKKPAAQTVKQKATDDNVQKLTEKQLLKQQKQRAKVWADPDN